MRVATVDCLLQLFRFLSSSNLGSSSFILFFAVFMNLLLGHLLSCSPSQVVFNSSQHMATLSEPRLSQLHINPYYTCHSLMYSILFLFIFVISIASLCILSSASLPTPTFSDLPRPDLYPSHFLTCKVLAWSYSFLLFIFASKSSSVCSLATTKYFYTRICL